MFEQPSLPGFGELPKAKARPNVGRRSDVTHGLFFALLPDDGASARAHALAEDFRHEYRLKEPALARELLHVTLVWLGEHRSLPRELVALAREVAPMVTAEPFDVSFDRVMSFNSKKGKRPLVLLSNDGSTQLAELRQSIAAAFARVGLHIRLRKSDFVPHVTLLYDPVDIKAQPIVPIRWTVRDFALVHSLRGHGLHLHLGRWRLGSRLSPVSMMNSAT